MDKIELIKQAIEKAKHRQSNMDEVAWSVPALSSLNIRHLMNNLGAISTNYLECGVHKGGLFCSTIRNNRNLESVTANDNWASDENSNEKAEDIFRESIRRCVPIDKWLHVDIRKCDTFDLLPIHITGKPIDLYLFDADHSYESQRKAITHFMPAMADEFIICVDDHDWDDVWKGTHAGLLEAGVEVLFEDAFKGGDHDNDGWWNGFYVALLKKKA